MKTKIELLVLLVIFLLSSYLIYTFVKPNTNDYIVSEDEINFKKEYEDLNDKQIEGKDYSYMSVSIKDNNNVEYKDANEIIDILKNGTGVIYFGFPECPWCRNLIPVLVDTVSSYSVGPIYYFNAREIRDTKVLDENGNIVTEKEGTKEYYEIVDILKEHLGNYSGLNDDSIKRLYFPTVVFVKNGEITKVHIGTVDSQEDPFKPLTEEQHDELVSILEDGIEKTFDVVCDENC